MKKMMKKISIFAIVGAMAISAFALNSCSPKKTNPTNTTSRYLREGYTEQFDGFTGVVHWVENTSTQKKIYSRVFKPDDFDENKQYPSLIMSHGFNSVGEADIPSNDSDASENHEES